MAAVCCSSGTHWRNCAEAFGIVAVVGLRRRVLVQPAAIVKLRVIDQHHLDATPRNLCSLQLDSHLPITQRNLEGFADGLDGDAALRDELRVQGQDQRDLVTQLGQRFAERTCDVRQATRLREGDGFRTHLNNPHHALQADRLGQRNNAGSIRHRVMKSRTLIVSELCQQKKEAGHSFEQRASSSILSSAKRRGADYFMKKSDGPLQV
ncbi:MAG: hypothetical protein FD138_3176 [Planctomycetota bacterium]|nr:MAG: hypothetical protein FD138_3176 [Planctomycetota bacterium]